MGQPVPPGDSPLIEGLDASWNEFVSYIPEDKRAEFAPKFKERISSYEPLKAWEDMHKSGITPEEAGNALSLWATIENNPQEVYKTLGDHLGITKEQAKEVVKTIDAADKEAGGLDPQIAELKHTVETMSQIMLAQRNMSTQEKLVADQEAAVDKELSDLKTKYGSDVNEREVLLRMLNDGMTAEQAHTEFMQLADQIRSRRPAPRIMGSGGVVPSNAIDPKKLNSADTKNLVAQMLSHAKTES